MKRLTILFAVLAVFLWVGSATATPVVDGVFNLSEWAGYYAQEDTQSTSLSYQVWPGYGGQYYDVEYLGLYITADTVYFGLQTGFNLENGYGGFAPGDFALDVDNNDTYDYAIDFSISGSSASFTLYDNPNWQNSDYSSLWGGVSDPFQNTETSDVAGGFSGSFNNSAVDAYGNASYVIEASFDRSLLNTYGGGPMTIHWTMECGNDYLSQTSAPVPEPATMLLFGVGLCGLAFVGRKKLIRQG